MRDVIEAAIRTLTAEWIDQGLVARARDVGDGLCEEFAEAVMARLPEGSGATLVYSDEWWERVRLPDGSPSPDEAECFVTDIPRLRAEGAPLPGGIPDDRLAGLLGAATHTWITWNGIHFDASAPEGRAHWLLMPFYADQVAGLAGDTARERASDPSGGTGKHEDGQ